MKVLFLSCILAISVLVGSSLLQEKAYAEHIKIFITVTAAEGSDTIFVAGHATPIIPDITFTVTSPDGFNRLAVDQITSNLDGDFATNFTTNPLWNQNGFYTITALYDDDGSL